MHRSLIRMILAASLAVMAVGAPSAAWSCATSAAMNYSCDDPNCGSGNPIVQDCAMVCLPACAAILTDHSGATIAFNPPTAIFATGERPTIHFNYSGPEPPPPRFGKMMDDIQIGEMT